MEADFVLKYRSLVVTLQWCLQQWHAQTYTMPAAFTYIHTQLIHRTTHIMHKIVRAVLCSCCKGHKNRIAGPDLDYLFSFTRGL